VKYTKYCNRTGSGLPNFFSIVILTKRKDLIMYRYETFAVLGARSGIYRDKQAAMNIIGSDMIDFKTFCLLTGVEYNCFKMEQIFDSFNLVKIAKNEILNSRYEYQVLIVLDRYDKHFGLAKPAIFIVKE
jgi:hypothetical protein